MGKSEELGTGVRNVFKYSKAYSGSDEILFQEDDVFTTKVPLRKLNATVNATVNERQKGILKKANEDRNITVSQTAGKLNVSRDTILRVIKITTS